MIKIQAIRTRTWLSFSLLYAFILSASAGNLAVVPVRASTQAGNLTADGVVEAIRQSSISAQISGSISQLGVVAGDKVKAGQRLLAIDARAANQATVASRAQDEVVQTALSIATKEFQRQKQLFTQNFISKAQLERAESQYQTAVAQAKAN